MTTELTFNQALRSLNRWEELEIRKVFGDLPADLTKSDPIGAGRALVYVIAKRDGSSPAEAKALAFEMPLGDVDDYFTEEPVEIDPEDPVTDAGKGSGQPEPMPVT